MCLIKKNYYKFISVTLNIYNIYYTQTIWKFFNIKNNNHDNKVCMYQKSIRNISKYVYFVYIEIYH